MHGMQHGEHHQGNCHVDRIESQFDPTTQTGEMLIFRIIGMGCQNCANRVHNVLIQQRGVKDAHVDLRTSRAMIIFDPETFHLGVTLDAVRTADPSGHHQYRAVALPALSM